MLEAGATVNYVWDDLRLTHKLVVTIQGDLNFDSQSVHIHIGNVFTSVCHECRLEVLLLNLVTVDNQFIM